MIPLVVKGFLLFHSLDRSRPTIFLVSRRLVLLASLLEPSTVTTSVFKTKKESLEFIAVCSMTSLGKVREFHNSLHSEAFFVLNFVVISKFLINRFLRNFSDIAKDRMILNTRNG